jgi:hypothetical protein
MKNLHKCKTRIPLLFALLLLLMSPVNAASDEFNEYTEDSHFIANRGNIPDNIDQEWKNSIKDCWLNITKQIGPSYSEFDKAINSIGGGNGLLTVYIGSAYEGQINDSIIDEMYQKIEFYCEENCGINDVPVVFLWDEDDEDLALPDYGPNMFEKAKNSSEFVAARGTMPIIIDEGEKREWIDQLVQCSRANDKIINYFKSSGGPVLSFGTYINGYLEVGLNSATPEKVNDSVIDEIYQTINEAAEEEGVSAVPVVFVWTEVAQEDELKIDEPSLMEDDFENESTQDGDDPTHPTPGFTSSMFALCMLILAIFRR